MSENNLNNKIKLFLIDLDGTLVSFQPTGNLYKELFFNKPGIKFKFLGIFMKILLKSFWFFPRIVLFQRKLILTIFSKANENDLMDAVKKISQEIENEYRENFLTKFEKNMSKHDQIFLLSHCPEQLGIEVSKRLNFNGQYCLKIGNYFSEIAAGNEIVNFNKQNVIKNLKKGMPDAIVIFLTDELIDLSALKAADVGILVNGSIISKAVCKIFFKKIEVWEKDNVPKCFVY